MDREWNLTNGIKLKIVSIALKDIYTSLDCFHEIDIVLLRARYTIYLELKVSKNHRDMVRLRRDMNNVLTNPDQWNRHNHNTVVDDSN